MGHNNNMKRLPILLYYLTGVIYKNMYFYIYLYYDGSSSSASDFKHYNAS